MRKSTVIALALLWAPTNQAFQTQNNARSSPTVTPAQFVLSAVSSPNANDSSDDSFDWDALERKNASRKKFGLKPMSPEEFLENEGLVQQMALEQQQRAATAAAMSSADKQRNSRSSPTTPVPGFLDKIFGDVLPDTCESNFDCEAPKVCCDFGVSKVCCSGGSKQRSREGELALVPVPVDVFPPSKY